MEATHDKERQVINWGLFAIITIPSFNYYLNNIITRLIGTESIGLYIYIALILFSFYCVCKCYVYGIVNNRTKHLVLFLVLFTLISCVLYNEATHGMLIRPDYHPIFSEALNTMVFGVPALVLASSCNNWNYILKNTVKIAPVISSMAFSAFYLSGFATWGDGAMDYLNLSYNVLPFLCAMVIALFQEKKLFFIPFIVVSTFIIVAAGSRGALVSFGLFLMAFIYCQLKTTSSKKSQKIYRFLVLGILALLVTNFFSYIDYIGGFFEKLGITSRTVETLSDQSFLVSEGRDNIREAILTGLWDNPLGYGLFGDRYITSIYYSMPEYSHNLIVEFFADFGIFIAPVLMCWLLVKIIKMTNAPLCISNCFWVIASCGIFRLFFTGSYLTTPYFFLILGILLNKSNYINKQYE